MNYGSLIEAVTYIIFSSVVKNFFSCSLERIWKRSKNWKFATRKMCEHICDYYRDDYSHCARVLEYNDFTCRVEYHLKGLNEFVQRQVMNKKLLARD